jgi:hypothetical protein
MLGIKHEQDNRNDKDFFSNHTILKSALSKHLLNYIIGWNHRQQTAAWRHGRQQTEHFGVNILSIERQVSQQLLVEGGNLKLLEVVVATLNSYVQKKERRNCGNSVFFEFQFVR